jgi:putative transposase
MTSSRLSKRAQRARALPDRDRPPLRRRLRAAWALDDHARALHQLRVLADELTRAHPGAAASLREGMQEN